MSSQLHHPAGSQRRSKLATIAGIAGFVLLVTACGGPSPTSTSPTEAAPASPTAAVVASAGAPGTSVPVQGGTLTVAVQADLRESDNMLVRVAQDKLIMGSTVYDPLVATDEKGQPAPALAESWTHSADVKVWTIQVRQGVKFQNGKTLTAADIVANFKAIADPAVASNLLLDLSNIIDVEATGTYEVKFTLKLPEGEFLADLMDTAYIGDMDARKAMGAKAWAQQPIGTGPYKWSSRAPGDSITFVRFDDYWRGRPPLDKVVFKAIPDPEVATLQLLAGGIDMMANYISVNALPKLKTNPDIQIQSLPGNTFYNTYLNFVKPEYTDSLAVRTGLAYLANYAEIVPPIIGDYGSYANQPIPPWQVGHDPDLQAYSYDPAKGKALLAQGGIPEGGTIQILALDRPFECQVGTALQSQLVGLGYDAKFSCHQAEDQTELFKYKWDMLLARESGRALASTNFRDRMACEVVITDVPMDSYSTDRSCAIDSLINEMLATNDQARYLELAKEVAKTVIVDRVGRIGMYWDSSWWPERTRVKGLKISPLGSFGFLMNAMGTVYVQD